jgi:hypothetical protein
MLTLIKQKLKSLIGTLENKGEDMIVVNEPQLWIARLKFGFEMIMRRLSMMLISI